MVLNGMVKRKSISLLVIMGMVLLPWEVICVTHPLGHKHQHHDGPSPCELRKNYKGEYPVFWPEMDCKHINAITDDFQQTRNEQIKPVVQTLVFVAVTLELIQVPYTEQPHLLPPEPRCRSIPIISSNSLRGPPIV